MRFMYSSGNQMKWKFSQNDSVCVIFFWPSIFFSQDIRCMTHRRHRRQTEVLRKKKALDHVYNTIKLCYFATAMVSAQPI